MSDKTKWTPGPWLVAKRTNDARDDGRFGIVSDKEELFVATSCCDVDVDDAKSDIIESANAHLMAAAPDLYQALASALDFMREHCDPALPLLSEMQDALDLASKGVA